MRKRALPVLLLLVLGATAGVALFLNTPTQYAATVTFYVGTPTTSTNPLSAGQFAQDRVTSYVELLSSDRLATKIVQSSNVDLTTRDIRKMISASAEPNTVLITSTVTDADAAQALALAKAVATDFPPLIDELDNQTGQGKTVIVSVVSGPNLLAAPVSHSLAYFLVIGITAGLSVGIAGVLAFDALDTSIRSTDQLAGLSDNPVLGRIAKDKTVATSPLVIGPALRSTRAEALRRIRTSVQFLDVGGSLQVIAVTSAGAGEGKSSVSSNLAISFSELGESVLLVGADLRRPSLAARFNISEAVGLSNVLVGHVSLEEALQPWGGAGLYVLASGRLPPNPAELLGSARMASLLTELRRKFDRVIIDTPPLLPVTDAAIIGTAADGVIVVVRQGRTSRAHLRETVTTLDGVGARLLGFVLNMASSGRAGKRTYGSYYGPKAGSSEVDADELKQIWSELRDGGDGSSRPRPTGPERSNQVERLAAESASSRSDDAVDDDELMTGDDSTGEVERGRVRARRARRRIVTPSSSQPQSADTDV